MPTGSTIPLTLDQKRTVAAAVAGSVLEYYDFAVYGFFAVYISKAFFPAESGLTSLLLAVATFGVGFVMRPVGAIVLGGYADKAGRKAGLTLTIILMAIGTAMIGLTPSYASIGAAAPIVIVLARLLQGFSAGGEFGSATALLVEHSPDGSRGRIGSLQQVSQGGALLLGSLAGAGVAALLSDAEMANWGWRLPFFFGLIILPVGLYLRANVHEGKSFADIAVRSKRPVLEAMSRHGAEIGIGFGITIAWTVCTYCLLIYMPTYAIREVGLPAAQALTSNAIGIVSVMLFAYLSGSLSDRLGRKAPMLSAAVIIAACVYFLFSFLTAAPSFANLVIVQVLLGALVGIYTGPAPTLIAEMFPAEVRSSGFSVAYNFAVTIFGGFAPLISTWLIAETGSKLAVTFYVMAAMIVSAIALLCLRPAADARTLADGGASPATR
jgi:MHS family proline/betaine transporter-like MFS transporter